MSVHRHGGDEFRPVYWYYACPVCGWCARLRSTRDKAMEDGVRHAQAKAKAAAA